MARIRSNFKTGTITSLNNSTGLTLPTGGLGIAVSSGDYIAVTINPAPFGSTPNSEIVYLNGPIGSTDVNIPIGQITRGAEGTSSSTSWASGTVWSHGATAQDFTLASGLINGDFPRPTASGQLFASVASGNTLPVWASSIPATLISGGTFPSSVTISGSQIYGDLSANATISGSKITGNILATQISGGLVQSSVRISGSQVVGSIAASQISGTLSTNTVVPISTISGTPGVWTVLSGFSTFTNTAKLAAQVQVSGYSAYIVHASCQWTQASADQRINFTLTLNNDSYVYDSSAVTTPGTWLAQSSLSQFFIVQTPDTRDTVYTWKVKGFASLATGSGVTNGGSCDVDLEVMGLF